MLVGVHGDVAGDVVENVGLGKIVELVGTPDGDGRREFAIAQAIEKRERRNVPADRLGFESSARAQELIDLVEPGNPPGLQAQRIEPRQKLRIGVSMPAGKHARVQAPPGFMIFRRIQLIRLTDVELTPAARVLDEGSFGRGQTDLVRC